MGQRHQVYVIAKQNNEFRGIAAFHHQWCYGLTAVVNITRAAQLIQSNKMRGHEDTWNDYYLNDAREIETVIKATYGVSRSGYVSMVHNESEFLIDAETDRILPDRGDNNDGCALIVIDNDAKEVRVGMFTPGHVEGKHGEGVKKNRVYTRQEYLKFYYTDLETSQFQEEMKADLKFFESSGLMKPANQSDLDLAMGIVSAKPKKESKPRAKRTVKKPSLAIVKA